MRAPAARKYARSSRWKIPGSFARCARSRSRSLSQHSGLLQGVVPREDLRETLAKMLGELLGDVDRAVLTAGAAHRDGQVAAVRLREFADAAVQEFDQLRDHAAHAGVAGQIFDHGRVAAGQMAQPMLPVGIRQAAYVEDEIRIPRYAVLVAEGLEHEGEPPLAPAVDALANQFAQ